MQTSQGVYFTYKTETEILKPYVEQ